jgi:flagella basal body P-ring formation protein FlgA
MRRTLLVALLLPAAMAGSAGALGAQQASLVEQVFPVATRRLARGTVLSSGDVTFARVSVRTSDAAAQAGWVTRRVVEAGEPLRAPAVAPLPMVAMGQRVLYVMQDQGIRLTIDGRAMGTGQLGDHVAVRLGANRRVEGIVTGAGEVSGSASPRNP